MLWQIGEATEPHRDFDDRVLIANKDRRDMAVRTQFECDGMLRVEELKDGGRFAIIECDKCSYQFVAAIPSDPQTERLDALARAGMPAGYRDKPFAADAGNEAARRLLREWLAMGCDLPAPALWGKPGVGKTHALCTLCEWMVSHERRVYYTTVAGALDRMQREMDTGDDYWQSLLVVPYLIADDLGAERETEWRADRLGRLIDERHAAERVIIVGSNFAPDLWAGLIGDREASRLWEMTIPCEMTGADRRRDT